MGNFLKTLKNARSIRTQFFTFFQHISLTKLQQYYCFFKSISETYSLDNQQFSELLAGADIKTDDLFQCLDTDQNLLIDGLQLFTTLCLLSNDIKFRDKIVFLFQLFDFNGLRSLSRTDIQFLLVSCCSGVAKLWTTVPQDSFVQEFVHEQFTKEERINISQILKWASSCNPIQQFFNLIQQQYERQPPGLLSEKIHLKLPERIAMKSVVVNNLNLRQQQFIDNTYRIFKQPNEQNQQQLQIRGGEITARPEWIYGIRFTDVRMFIEIVGEQLVYFSGKMIILYHMQAHRQRFYQGHHHQVISLTSNPQKTLIASSQYAPYPQIKIWSIRSLQTLHRLTGHTRGVHLLLFMPGLLVSVGCHEQSPVMLHSLNSAQCLFSTYCLQQAVDMASVTNFTNNPTQQLVIATLRGIDHYQLVRNEGGVQVVVSRMRQTSKQTSRITSVCFFMVNSRLDCLDQYDDRMQKCLLAGYQNGQVAVWNVSNSTKMYIFSHQNNQIVRMIPMRNCLLIGSNSSFIRVYELHIAQAKIIQTIDLTQISQQLQNYDLFDMLVVPQGVLVVTQAGQLVVVQDCLGQHKPTLTNLTHHQFPAHSISDLLHLSLPISNQQLFKPTPNTNTQLFITQGHRIKSIELQTHKFSRQWNIGQKVLAFDVTTTKHHSLLIVAAAEHSQNQSMLCSLTQVSQNPGRQILAGHVLNLLILQQENTSHITILVCIPTTIHKYTYYRGTLTKNISLNLNGEPYPRLTLLEPQRLLMTTRDNGVQGLLPNRQQQPMHVQNIQPLSVWSNHAHKVYCQLRRNVQEQAEMLANIVSPYVKILAACRCDGSITLWPSHQDLLNNKSLSLQAHTSPPTDINLFPDQKYLISSGNQDQMIIQWRIQHHKQLGSATRPLSLPQSIQNITNDIFAQQQIDFCMFNNQALTQLYDQHLQVHGLKHQNIKKLFKSTLNQGKIINRNNQNAFHLKLDFAFGIQTFHKNNTIHVLENPRRLVYFVGKIVVIYSTALNSQSFYRGHKFKVTCLSLIPTQRQAVSGQSAFQPVLNIWSVITLDTLAVISTRHRWGIIELAVHNNTLLSFGFRDKKQDEEGRLQPLYLFQMHHIDSGQSVGTGQQQHFVHSMALDPGNPHIFASCTDHMITFWQVKGNVLIKRSRCPITKDTPSACLYYQPHPNAPPDLIVGTKKGSLGIVSRQKYWQVFIKSQMGHYNQINCLALAQCPEQTLILASSEDNQLRAWNLAFQQKYTINLLRDHHNQEHKKLINGRDRNNRSLQSLCLLDSKQLKILGGTRNGQIIQISLLKSSNDNNKEPQDKTITRFNSGDGSKGKGRVLVSHHPRYDVLATLGEDQVVIFWDCERKKILHMNELGLDQQKTRPTAMKFNHNGDYLIIGFSDGLLVFVDSKLSRAMQGKGDEKMSQSSQKTLAKNEGWTVVAIQTSEGGQFMAVSYHRFHNNKSKAQVKIFASKANTHKSHRPNKSQGQKAYQLHSIVDNPNLDHSYSTSSNSPCGFAVISMTFAQYQGSQYLLMFFQLIDQYQNRVWSSQNQQDLKYKIKHVNNNTDIPNTSSLNQLIKWKKTHLLTAISASYLIQEEHGQQLPNNNHLRIPQFTTAHLVQGQLCLGSENGDIHLVAVPAIDNGGIATTTPAHSCTITHIEHSHDRSVIYSTGQQDHLILRWTLQSHPQLPQTDSTIQDTADLFAQIPQPDYLSNRQDAYHHNFSRTVIPTPTAQRYLKLHDIIGRHAYGVRNNLKIDQRGKLVYHSGQSIILSSLSNNNKQFLTTNRTLQQITTIQLSQDRQILIAAHTGLQASILVWRISSKLLLKNIILPNIVQVVYMCLSYNNARLVVYCLKGKQAQGCILMIDLVQKQIIATSTYLRLPNWLPKQIIFSPNTQDQFYTCGVQPLKCWNLHSRQLISTALNSPDPTRIHTCLAFVNETLISGTDQGQLVVWKEEPQVIAAHQQIMTCMDVREEDEGIWMVATGSQASLDGDVYQIILWVVTGQCKDIQQIKHITAHRDMLTTSHTQLGGRSTSRYQSQLQIQSLSFDLQGNLIIGLLKGDIFNYPISLPQIKNQPSQSTLLMAFQDSQCTKSIFFSEPHHQLIDISQHGLLRVWRFPFLQLVFDHHFDQEVVEMVYSPLHDLILVGFRGQLRFLGWGLEKKVIEEIQERSMQFNFLTHVVLSQNQKIVALGIQSNSDHSHLIEVYQLSLKQFRMKLKMRFDSAVDYIDFNRSSGQRNFILVKTQTRLQLYDLTTLSQLNHTLSFKLDWLGPGLQIADKTKKSRQLHNQLSGAATIKSINQTVHGTVIVDIYGDLYLFRDGELVGRSCLKMAGAQCVGICGSGRWCGIASKWDRNIVVWDLQGQ